MVRVVLGESFDNEPYVGDVAGDYTFLKSFAGLSIKELADLRVGRGQVEGVSGATMTSQSLARAIRGTAKNELREQRDAEHQRNTWQ